MKQFRAPGVRFDVDYDEALVRAICEEADAIGLPAGTEGERDASLDHGTMIPLYFAQEQPELRALPIVRISLSGLPLEEQYRFGMCIRRAVDQLGRRAVFIGSGDLSHKCRVEGPYGFAPEGPEYDRRLTDVMARGAFGELLDRLGIRDNDRGIVGFNSFRNSFVTRCDAAGVPRHAIRGIVGHVSDDMTDLYSHDLESARQIQNLPSVKLEMPKQKQQKYSKKYVGGESERK